MEENGFAYMYSTNRPLALRGHTLYSCQVITKVLFRILDHEEGWRPVAFLT